MSWYATIQPGLEPALVDELGELGFVPKECPGGVRFEADANTGAALTWTLRTPSSLLCELIEAPCRSSDELVGLIRKVRWKDWILPTAEVGIEVTTKGSRLHFKESIVRTVRGVLGECMKGPRIPDLEKRARQKQSLHVRFVDDRVTLSLDAGGELLHFRGWRQSPTAAPLRENLAAALLRLANWTGTEPLVDPFCGSGTIPIEAALLAMGRSSFGRRHFACEEWPCVKARPANPKKARLQAMIVGADRDPRAIVASAENAARAGVNVRWQEVDLADIQAPVATGLVLTNPPYGHRLGQNVRGVYITLGRVLRERFAGWRVMFLCPDPSLATAVDPRVRRRLVFPHGGLRVGVWEFEV